MDFRSSKPVKHAAVFLALLFGFSGLALTTCLDQRIADGELTTLGQYPFVLSLGLTSWADIYHLHYCSGSIITEAWVLTSAQCIEDAVEDVSRYYWLAGTNNLRQRGSRYPINRIIIHPGYNPNDSYIHDIAVAQVRHPFEFSATIQPVVLSSSVSATSYGTSGVVVGWGETQTVIQPDVLRSAKLTIIDVPVCQRIYAPWEINIDGDYQFCAIGSVSDPSNELVRNIDNDDTESYDSLVGDRSACRGDEGGPFLITGTNFPLISVSGIVSWSYGCSPSGYPTAYTKVSNYLQWISANTGYWIV